MNNTKSFLPKIIRKHVVIDDDYIRKNYDGNKLALQLGAANVEKRAILVIDYVFDENITLLKPVEIKKEKQRLDAIDEDTIIAHESQHIHNGAIGYNYLANSDNIYECMMLSLADEMSAMMAGYLHKTKNVDMAMSETIKNLSGTTRKNYINRQFATRFQTLQKVFGKDKNLYEHKFDTHKIHKLLQWYFTIDGHQVMNQMSKKTLLKYSQFMLELKSDINKFIDNQIAMQHGIENIK